MKKNEDQLTGKKIKHDIELKKIKKRAYNRFPWSVKVFKSVSDNSKNIIALIELEKDDYLIYYNKFLYKIDKKFDFNI